MNTFCGKQICWSAFQIVYDVKEHTLDSLQKHVHTNGITPRIHRTKIERLRPNAFTFNEVRYVANNLQNYATRNGIPHPAGPQGGDPDPPVFLSCSDTNDEIQKQYIEDCRKNGICALSLSSFKDVWLKCTPHIKVSTARSDVCSLSEKHRNAIREPITDAEKLDATANFPKTYSDCRAEEKQKTDRFDHGTSGSRQRIWAYRSLLKATQKSSLYFWFLTAN